MLSGLITFLVHHSLLDIYEAVGKRDHGGVRMACCSSDTSVKID
jgi:hypothetical protein